jgi:hypothetical protein
MVDPATGVSFTNDVPVVTASAAEAELPIRRVNAIEAINRSNFGTISNPFLSHKVFVGSPVVGSSAGKTYELYHKQASIYSKEEDFMGAAREDDCCRLADRLDIAVGTGGHSIVAEIAQRRLDAASLAKIQGFLGS